MQKKGSRRRSTSVYKQFYEMAQSKPIKTWKEIEKDSPEQRRCYLESKLRGRESICRYSDIKLGDHLVTKGGINGVLEYEHHFLCTGFDEKGEPMIIHYYQSWLKARIWPMYLTSFFGSGSFLTMKGEIQEVSLRDYIKEEDLQGKEVKRVVWPDELRRFSAVQVVRRARKRKGAKGESNYDLMENNCESFVMWCLCDFNTSLQVTPRRQITFEAVSAALWKILGQIPKLGLERLEYVRGLGISRLLKLSGNPVLTDSQILNVLGVFMIVLYEAIALGIACSQIKKDWKGCQARVKSDNEFYTEVANKVLVALFRSGGSIAFMFLGQIVGALIGAVVGQFLARIFSATNAIALAQSIQSKIKEITVKLSEIPFFEAYCT